MIYQTETITKKLKKMTKANAIKKLTANGYTVVKCFSGNIIATRFGQNYKANSLNALIKLLF